MGVDYVSDYFQWLCETVGIDRHESGYWILAKDLHNTEFTSIIPHDENRVANGLSLRNEYLDMTNYPEYVQIVGPCTMFEMLVSVARDMDFELDDPEVRSDSTERYFWELIDNLGLTPYDDEHYVERRGMVNVGMILWRLNNREYDSDGRGGLFPLKHPPLDQRRVEIWYQMNAYLQENYG